MIQVEFASYFQNTDLSFCFVASDSQISGENCLIIGPCLYTIHVTISIVQGPQFKER